jgi:transcriptional regulator with XRE-family HTH domain
MTKEETKKAIREAVKYLKKQGAIEADKDIMEKTGFGKSAVSLYINGNADVSDKFVRKFEEVFKLDLEKFKPVVTDIIETKVNIPAHDDKSGDYQEEYINLLKKTLQDKEERIRLLIQQNQMLQKKVAKSLETVVKDLLTSHAMNEAYHEQIVEFLLAMKETNGQHYDVQDFLESVHTKGFDKVLELEKKGIYVDTGKQGNGHS